MPDLDSILDRSLIDVPKTSPSDLDKAPVLPAKTADTARSAEVAGAGSTADLADFDKALTILENLSSSSGDPVGALLFSAPPLEPPSDIPPEQLEAMVMALLGDASSKIIDVNKKLLKLTDLQRQELSQKLKDATAKAEASLDLAKSKAGAVSVGAWVRAIGAVVGSFIFLVIGAQVSGGLATAGLLALFVLSVVELVNTGLKSQANPILVTGPDGTVKQLEISIGGLVQQIVEQINHDQPGSFTSSEKKQEVIANWTMGLTVFITAACFLSSLGVSAGANASVFAGSGGSSLANIISIGALSGSRAVAATAEIAAGAATIVEGVYKLELAGINLDTENARAERRLLMTYLDVNRKDIDIFLDAFMQAYKLRDQSLETTSANFAAASATRSSIARNMC